MQDTPSEAPETCLEIRSALPLFVGQDLEADEAKTVEEHLIECGSCREAHDRAREAREALVGMERPSDSPDLWSGIRATLAEEGLFRQAGPRLVQDPVTPAPRFRLLPVGLASAAAAVLCAFALQGAMGSGGVSPVNDSGFSPLPGGTNTGTFSVGYTEQIGETEDTQENTQPDSSDGTLRVLGDDEEDLYLRAREFTTEQGVVVPRR